MIRDDLQTLGEIGSLLGGATIDALGLPKDCRRLVRAGYDACADAYAEVRAGDDPDQIAPLLEVLPDGSSILDLGCGAGIPIARALSTRYRITGVDTSRIMLGLAEANVPEARFIHGDVLDVELGPSSFDAAAAIFVVFHLPREEHGRLFERVRRWLRPGGYFLISLTQDGESARIRHDFFGTDMYWSRMGFAESMKLLEGLGFEVVRERIVVHGYGHTAIERDERNPLTLVRKPSSEP